MHPEVFLDELDSRGCCMCGRDILLKSREARVSYTPIVHGCGETLDDVTFRFCVHRRCVVDEALEQKWSNHAEGQQSR